MCLSMGANTIDRECEEQPPNCITVVITNGRRDLMFSPRQIGTVTCLDGATAETGERCSIAPQASQTQSTVASTSRVSWNSTGSNRAPHETNTPLPTIVTSVAGRTEPPGSMFLTITQTLTSLLTTTVLSS